MPTQPYGAPSTADGCVDCHFALHDEVDCGGGPDQDVEEFAEDLGGQPERRVRNDTKRRPRQAKLPKVRFDDARSRLRPLEPRCCGEAVRPRRITLDCPYLGAGVEQRKRERTRAGAEIDDEFAVSKVERTNEPIDDVAINEKVLAEFATPRVSLGWLSPGHGPSPSSSCPTP